MTVWLLERRTDKMFEQLEEAVMRSEEIVREMSDREVANDSERLKALLREQAEIMPVVDCYREYKKASDAIEENMVLLRDENDPEMRQMIKEDLQEEKDLKEKKAHDLKVLLLPKDPNDNRNVIMEIRSGAGGDEAALFASEIYRMYCHFIDRKGWKMSVMESELTGLGGIKKINFCVEGKGAYSILKYESGVHRVQRVPQTESGGRIHTSTCTVAVMPEAEDVDIVINEKDIRIDVMRASGNGGQCVNTTDSAVRLTHYPTGIVIYSQTEKSQIQNKEKAFNLLRTKLYDLELQKRQKEASDERLSQIGTGDRSEKIRTYNFPQGRVTDHRINLTIYQLDRFLDGDLEMILDPLIAADQEKKLLRMNEEK
jgi:peptide chain release factor 1